MELIKYIREYVDIQKALISAFKQKYPDLKDELFLTDYPKYGSLSIGKKTWNFTKHGKGVRFESANDSLVVDVCQDLHIIDGFDIWRLEEYFTSKGIATSSDTIKKQLEYLQSEKLIRAYKPNSYIFI